MSSVQADVQVVLSIIATQPSQVGLLMQVFKANVVSSEESKYKDALAVLGACMRTGGPVFHSLVFQHLLERVERVALEAADNDRAEIAGDLVIEWGEVLLPHVQAFVKAAARVRQHQAERELQDDVVKVTAPETPLPDDDDATVKAQNQEQCANGAASASASASGAGAGASAPNSIDAGLIFECIDQLQRVLLPKFRDGAVKDSLAKLLAAEIQKRQAAIATEIEKLAGGVDQDPAMLDELFKLHDAVDNVLGDWNRVLAQVLRKGELSEDDATLCGDIGTVRVSIRMVCAALQSPTLASVLGGLQSQQVTEAVERLDRAQLTMLRLANQNDPAATDRVALAREIGDILIAWRMVSCADLLEASNTSEDEAAEMAAKAVDVQKISSRLSDAGYDSVLVESGIVEVIESWEVARREPMIGDALDVATFLRDLARSAVAGTELARESSDDWEVVTQQEATQAEEEHKLVEEEMQKCLQGTQQAENGSPTNSPPPLPS